MNKSKTLKKLLTSRETLIMPDAYDPISARLIEKAGFKAVQCSGYSFSISAGYRREIDVSLEENIELTRKIVDAVDLPVMADAEDGYGDADTVKDTVRRFIEAGVAGLNIEDQVLDKVEVVRVINPEKMVEKIIAAREVADAEANPDFIINGRTDALKTTKDRSEALDMAIKRVNLYLDAGADLAFITYVETLDEVKRIMKKVKGSVSIAAGMPYNIKKFSIADLKKCGVARVSLPTLLIFSSLCAINLSLRHIRDDDFSSIIEGELLYSGDELTDLLNK